MKRSVNRSVSEPTMPLREGRREERNEEKRRRRTSFGGGFNREFDSFDRGFALKRRSLDRSRRSSIVI